MPTCLYFISQLLTVWVWLCHLVYSSLCLLVVVTVLSSDLFQDKLQESEVAEASSAEIEDTPQNAEIPIPPPDEGAPADFENQLPSPTEETENPE